MSDAKDAGIFAGVILGTACVIGIVIFIIGTVWKKRTARFSRLEAEDTGLQEIRGAANPFQARQHPYNSAHNLPSSVPPNAQLGNVTASFRRHADGGPSSSQQVSSLSPPNWNPLNDTDNASDSCPPPPYTPSQFVSNKITKTTPNFKSSHN